MLYVPSQFFLLSLVPKNTNQKVVLFQGKRAQLLHVTTPAGSATFANPPSPQDNAEHQELERELEVRWAHFLDCYIHRQRARGVYKCHRLGISGLLKHKDTVCKVDQATADKVSHKAFFFFFSGTELSFFYRHTKTSSTSSTPLGSVPRPFRELVSNKNE